MFHVYFQPSASQIHSHIGSWYVVCTKEWINTLVRSHLLAQYRVLYTTHLNKPVFMYSQNNNHVIYSTRSHYYYIVPIAAVVVVVICLLCFRIRGLNNNIKIINTKLLRSKRRENKRRKITSNMLCLLRCACGLVEVGHLHTYENCIGYENTVLFQYDDDGYCNEKLH